MNVAEFNAKWKDVDLTERSSAQTHFNDLCALFEHPDPVKADPKGLWFTFEKGVSKAGGGEGWADVWKRGFFGWEYKGKHKDLNAAYLQLLRYQGALENPPLLVTCDTNRIEIHTHFPNTPTETIVLTLEDLLNPEKFGTLRAVFHEPGRLRPARTVQAITEEAAARVSAVAQQLRERAVPPERVARFLDRVVFCFFAEDVGLLPNKVFTRVVDNAQGNPDTFKKLAAQLFECMALGGHFGADRIEHFNGDLFDAAEALDLTAAELKELRAVSQLDWTNIDASIFGTLFERALDPDKRSQLGAHYTSRDDIETLIVPVVVAPLRQEWAGVREKFDALVVGMPSKKQWDEAKALIRGFLNRLASVTVLDPACGSGNFLFVTLQRLKDLEKEVIVYAASYFPFFPQVGPWQLHGIEVNRYAHELAQMTVWIGHLQWHQRNGMPLEERPILRRMSNFEQRDAVLMIEGNAISEPEWPSTTFIVSNPPFLGRAKLREYLGDDYVQALYTVWSNRVPAEADYCCYWFEKARRQLVAGRVGRVGLLATQSIRKGASHEVLVKIQSTGGIFFAESDRPWTVEGAAVRVSMVGFDNGSDKSPRVLDGNPVDAINSDLTSGADFTVAVRLARNAGLCFQGPVKVGEFDVGYEVAKQWLNQPNPHGRPNSDVLRPWLNGQGIAKRNPHRFIVDFAELREEEASLYEMPFRHVELQVKPSRLLKKRARRKARWWQHGETVPTLRRLCSPLARFICTVRVSEHRLFVWVPSSTLPDARLYAIASCEDWLFGVLHSRVHEVWSLKKASVHGDGSEGGRPTYGVESCFLTFPFPDASDAQREAVAEAARRLQGLRQEWLNPTSLVVGETLFFPARVDGPWKHCVTDADANGVGMASYTRLLPVDDQAAKLLKGRTLTALYNESPAWLRDAHRVLDEAVLSAYGWNLSLSGDELLQRVLDLNRARAAADGPVSAPEARREDD